MDSRADEYRKTAEECRQMADRALHPDDKERWRRIERQWLDLADQEDESQEKRSLT